MAEIVERLKTEKDCRRWLASVRWPNGFQCFRCGSDRAWPVRVWLLECARCGHQVSVTAGTFFEHTRTPLSTWLRAIWWITEEKEGASALGLQRAIGLKSYGTARKWLVKFRTVMADAARHPLGGEVEVGVAYLAPPEGAGEGRRTGSVLVAIAAQVDGDDIGYIRARLLSDLTSDGMAAFIRDSLEPGSTVLTDGSGGTQDILAPHNPRIVKSSETHRVQTVISLFRAWLIRNHQATVIDKHLGSPLDEFVFRFNARKSSADGGLFLRLIERTLGKDPNS
jgi:hypothetical protein